MGNDINVFAFPWPSDLYPMLFALLALMQCDVYLE